MQREQRRARHSLTDPTRAHAALGKSVPAFDQLSVTAITSHAREIDVIGERPHIRPRREVLEMLLQLRTGFHVSAIVRFQP